MLQISPEKIAHVIIRAREYDSGVNAWAHQGAADSTETAPNCMTSSRG